MEKIMINIQIIKNRFLELSKGEKLIKLKAMIALLKDALPMYNDIYIQLENLGDNVPEDVLILYYTMLCGNIESLQGDSLEKFKSDLQSFRKNLKTSIGVQQDQEDLESIEKALQGL